MHISHARWKEFRRKINGLLRPGIKISDLCLKFKTNVSKHQILSNGLENIDNSFKLALATYVQKHPYIYITLHC